METAQVQGRAGHGRQRGAPGPTVTLCTSLHFLRTPSPHPPHEVALTWEGLELEALRRDLVAGLGAAGRACGQRGDAKVHAGPGWRGLGRHCRV